MTTNRQIDTVRVWNNEIISNQSHRQLNSVKCKCSGNEFAAIDELRDVLSVAWKGG